MEVRTDQLTSESFRNSDTPSTKTTNSGDFLQNNLSENDKKLLEGCSQKITENLHYCVLCNVCVYGKNNIATHNNGKIHKFKIIDFGNNIEVRKKFVHNLSLHKNLYMPKGGGIFCKLCNIIIKYDYLQDHIDGKVHKQELDMKQNSETSPLISGAVSSKSLPLIKYITDDLMIKLKNAGAEQFPPSLQSIADNRFKCLICKVIDVNTVSSHVTNSVHETKYYSSEQRTILTNFHNYWRTSRYRKHQVYFYPTDDDNMECMLCSENMSHAKVLRHCLRVHHRIKAIEGFFHAGVTEQQNIFQILSLEFVSECVPNILKKPLPPSKLAEHFYSDPLLQKIYAREHGQKHVIKINNNFFYCYLCHAFSISRFVLEDHTLTPEHQALVRNPYRTAIIHSFHVDWAQFPSDLQLQQIFFSPSKYPHSFRCLCCKSRIRLTNILEHVYGNKHNRKVELYSKRYQIPDYLSLSSECSRSKIYPESMYAFIKQFSVTDWHNQTIQKISASLYKCLLCRIEIMPIAGHLVEKSHKELKQNETLIDNIRCYHTQWEQISDAFQKFQVDFEPIDKLKIYCVVCKEDILYEQLIGHLQNGHKNRKTENSSDTSNDSSEQQKPCTSVVVYYPLRLLKTLQKFEGKMSRNVQMISNIHYRCLLCRINTNDLEYHLQNDHKERLSDEKFCQSVKFYHNLWDALPNKWQRYQRDFFPLDESSIVCVCCETVVKNTEELLAHLTKYENVKTSVLTCGMSKFNLTKTTEKLNNLSLDSSSDENSDSDSLSDSEDDQRKSPNNRKSVLRKAELEGLWRSLPNKFSFNKRYIFWKNDELFCDACSVAISIFSRSDVMSHVTSNVHQLNLKRKGDESVYWKRLKYECLRCKKTSYDETSWKSHLDSLRHKELIKQNSNDIYKENFCTQCTLIMFGTDDHFKDHEHTKKKKKSKGLKIPTILQEYFQSPEKLEIFVNSLFDEALSVTSNDKLDRECCDSLKNSIEAFFPNCAVHRFGSRVSGLGTSNSDLDIFLDVDNMYDGTKRQSAESQSNLVIAVLSLLKQHPQIWGNFEPIPQARTPILRVFHKPTKLDCDISFRHGLSKENTKLLSFYLMLQPIARKLILFLKFWIAQLNFDQKFNSYALSMMVIFYLQMKKLLYSVSELKNMYPGQQRIIAGWECSFYSDLDNIEKIPCEYTFLESLADFFKYYTNFNYAEEVICPLLGRPVKKNDFHFTSGSSKLPAEMKNYIDRIEEDYEADYEPELFRSLSPLCVQDPFDLAHNLTKSIPGHVVIKFKNSCNLSYELLKKHLNKQTNNTI